MSKKKPFPDSTISFDLECNEDTIAFLRRQFKKSREIEEAIHERITQLFDEFVDVGGHRKSDGYKELLKLFAIGYQLGWNDLYNINKENRKNAN